MKNFFAVIALLVVLSPAVALAQTKPAALDGCTATDVTGAVSITRCVNQIYIWSMGAASLLALFMIVIGGYMTLTSGGNADRASKGKSFIMSSILGLVLLFGAYLLLRTINPDLVDFSNNCINNLESCAAKDSAASNQSTPATDTNPPPGSGTGLEGSPLDPGNTGCIYQCLPHN